MHVILDFFQLSVLIFFVPINQKNESNLKKVLQFRGRITADNYWEILGKIKKNDWYQCEVSTESLDYDLWSKRAAMLDAIYYSHEN